MLDLLIRGGQVVDGTGTPGRRADVGVRDGKVVAVGEVDESAARTVDADGLVVAPGIIDIHTHYDAQLCWDAYATPSSLHGVTTIVGGNCGFTLAPSSPADHEFLARMLSRVEGMPLEALVAGVPWDWGTFGEYLDRMEGRLGVNAGFLVGHTAIRRSVMGPDQERPARDDELAAMLRLLHEGIRAGGLGFSTSVSQTHNDADGRPVPSRHASVGELVALAQAAGEHPGTTLELVPPPGPFAPELIDLMTAMSAAADRPLNWNLINVSAAIREATAQRLAASDHAAAHGGCLVGLVLPDTSAVRLSFHNGFLLDALPDWDWLFELPPDSRLKALADPAARARLAAGANRPEAQALYYIVDWGGLVIGQTFAPANDGLAGRAVGEIASDRGVDPLDALLDIVVADDLRTLLVTPFRGNDEDSWALRETTVRDPRTIPGGSDSGAHLDMLDTFTMATRLVGPQVRDRGMLTLEEAVHLLTGVPAGLYGLQGRGVIREGAWADLFLFDPATVDAGPVHLRHDLPSGAPRLYGEALGVHHVMVAGVEIVSGTETTGALPGRTIRSGRDTTTVTAAQGRAASWRNL
jgi:N-acyl-D-aspartate/D-glutamate deacylase